MATATLATATLLDCPTTGEAVAKMIALVHAEAARFTRRNMPGIASHLHRLADELEDVATAPKGDE